MRIVVYYLFEWEGVETSLAPATRWPLGYSVCFVYKVYKLTFTTFKIRLDSPGSHRVFLGKV